MGQSRWHRENDVPEEVSILDRRTLTRLFPAFRLIGAIRQAFDLRKLIIAALGLALFQPGWSLLDQFVAQPAETTRAAITSSVPQLSFSEPGFWSWDNLASLHVRLSEPFRVFATLLFAFVDPGSGGFRALHALLSLIWFIVVWGICGGAIARIAIVQVASLRPMSVAQALRFAGSNARALLIAPLCPL